MGQFLSLYVSHKEWVNLAKDLVFFFGAFKVIVFIWNKNYVSKTLIIEKDLKVREFLEEKLNKYVYEEHRNGIRDIAVRFVYWKNYPWNFKDDGYKHLLHFHDNDGETLPSGYLDKTGINFEEHVWFFLQSVYVDQNGIFFIAPKEGSYRSFKEMKPARLIMHLPFSKIVNFDFKEFIEYEPVFYVRHNYRDYRKLYDPVYICREKRGESYFRIELNRRYHIRKYSHLRYLLSRAGLAVDRIVLKLLGVRPAKY